jgi:hypothetical protein
MIRELSSALQLALLVAIFHLGLVLAVVGFCGACGWAMSE